MSIVVTPLNRPFLAKISNGDDVLTFKFRQLNYATKSMITNKTTKVQQGQVMIDSAMTVFYNLKYGLLEVGGFKDEDGKEFKLEFDKVEDCLTDDCVDMLLATPISDNLIYTARELSNACVPTKVIHPATGVEIPNIEIVSPKELAATTKK